MNLGLGGEKPSSPLSFPAEEWPWTMPYPLKVPAFLPLNAFKMKAGSWLLRIFF